MATLPTMFGRRAAASVIKPTSGAYTRTFSVTRINPAEAIPPEVVLYQYAICPFCNIGKAALNFASVNFKTVEVNPLTKAEIKFSKDYRKVPIATLDGEQVNGSEKIIKKCLEHPAVASNLQKKLNNNLSTEAFLESEESRKWVEFAREELASLLYPNICSTWNDSYIAFDYVHKVDTFSAFQKFSIQNAGSLAMYFAASKIKSE
jgi:microsomal prostaglandin-E synthase 2